MIVNLPHNYNFGDRLVINKINVGLILVFIFSQRDQYQLTCSTTHLLESGLCHAQTHRMLRTLHRN